MTKWQESCIKALASSPLAWEAFKMKQRNKKLLWQYINRIWPYKLIVRKHSYSSNIHKLVSTLIDFQDCIQKKVPSELEEKAIEYFKYEFPDINLYVLQYIVYNKASLEGYNTIHQANGNHLFYITVNIDNRVEEFYSSGTGNLLYVLQKIFDRCKELHSINCIIKRIIFCSSIINTYAMLEQLKKEITFIVVQLSKLISKASMDNYFKEGIRIYNSLNVGIEIEHDAEKPTSNRIKKLILSKNCKSYDSGYDGNSSARLRENRIRLNGIKGLKGLYTLLIDMKQNCAIAKNSSVHMHIDCNYDSFYSECDRYYERDKNSSLNCHSDIGDVIYNRINHTPKDTDEKAYKIISKIVCFKINAGSFCMNSLVNYHLEFNTIEYRFLKINFNYSDYVIQILTLIHITECIKHNAPFNIQYLKLLLKVMKDLNN